MSPLAAESSLLLLCGTALLLLPWAAGKNTPIPNCRPGPSLLGEHEAVRKQSQQKPKLGKVPCGTWLMMEPVFFSVRILRNCGDCQHFRHLGLILLSIVTCGRTLLSSEVIDKSFLISLFANRSIANTAVGSQERSWQRML